MNQLSNLARKFPIRQATLPITALLILTTLPACSMMGSRDNHSSGFQKNVYATVGMGTSRLTPNVDNFPALDVNDRVEPAGQVTIGADLSNTFSIEVHSADLGSAGFSPSGGPDDSSSAGRYNYHMNGASALAYIGKNKANEKRRGLNGYGRLGLVSIDNSTTGNSLNYQRDGGSGLLLGAGLEYATRMGLGLRAEVMATDSDIKYGQIGINYRLGLGNKKRPALAAAKPVKTLPVIAAAKAITPPPPVIKPPAVMEPVEPLSGVVNFDSDSANLTANAKRILDGFAKKLSAYPEARLQLSAHADSTGADTYNQQLSQRRADSVVRYLANQGISASAISTSANGETSPVQANSTPQGRFQNRRVELNANNLTRKRIAQ